MLSNNCSILLIDDDADVLDAYTQLANYDFAVLLRHRHNVSNPLWIGSNSKKANIERLHHSSFDLFGHVGPHSADFLFDCWTVFSGRETVNHNICIQSRHVLIGPGEDLNIFIQQLN